jgi:hypothetical protein
MASALPTAPSPSPFRAASHAWEHTRRQLFPFRFERWLTLGFVAFLDQCGRSGGGGGGGAPPGSLGGGARWEEPFPGMPELPRLPVWLTDHLALIAALASVVAAVVLLLVALALWLGSRGIFVYLDDVATGRAEVARPWREHARLAASLFAWRVAVAAGTLVAGGFVLGLGGMVFVLLRRGEIAAVAGVALLLGVLAPLLVVLILGATLLSLALRDFVAPIQLAGGLACGEAFSRFLVLLKAQPGAFAIYLLLKAVFSVALALVVFVLGCATCCLGFLPVVAQTLFQPAFYFERAWSLHLLREMGCDVFAALGATAGPGS